jgi:hypothetical protein
MQPSFDFRKPFHHFLIKTKAYGGDDRRLGKYFLG